MNNFRIQNTNFFDCDRSIVYEIGIFVCVNYSSVFKIMASKSCSNQRCDLKPAHARDFPLPLMHIETLWLLCHCTHSVKLGTQSERENLSSSRSLVARLTAIDPAKMSSCSDESSHG